MLRQATGAMHSETEQLSRVALGFPLSLHVVCYSSLWLVSLPALLLPHSCTPLALCLELQLRVSATLAAESPVCHLLQQEMEPMCYRDFITSNERFPSPRTPTNAIFTTTIKKSAFDDKHGLPHFPWQRS